MQRRQLLTGAGALLSGIAGSAWAQTTVTGDARPIVLVVPFAPGGATDAIGRLLGRRVGELVGQPVVVENRPGAGGTIGIGHVARAQPGSRTLVLVNALQHTSAASLYTDLRYDAVTSFSPIATIGSLRYILVVHPSSSATRADEWVAEVRRQPGKFTYASAGVGSAPHLVMAYFASLHKLDMVHVPYKGSAPAMTDLAANVVNAAMDNVAAVPFIRSGRLRALAISGEQRMPSLPEVPTFDESGAPGFSVSGTWGLLGPAGMPRSEITLVAQAIRQALQDPAVIEQLMSQGITPEFGSAEDFGATLAQETARWRALITQAGIRL